MKFPKKCMRRAISKPGLKMNPARKTISKV